MTDPSQTYQAYLLRLWRLNDTMPWRATLVQAEGGRQYHFADVDQAWIYLRQRLADKQTSADKKECDRFPNSHSQRSTS